MTDRNSDGEEHTSVLADGAALVSNEAEIGELSPACHGRTKYIGLCESCQLRDCCTKEKLPGGIWSCNDYLEL